MPLTKLLIKSLNTPRTAGITTGRGAGSTSVIISQSHGGR